MAVVRSTSVASGCECKSNLCILNIPFALVKEWCKA